MKKNFLDSLEVKSPCTESWEEMTGSDEVRFCTHCAKQVYNISAMTRAKAEKLVENSNGGICVRYVKNADGKLLNVPPKLTPIKRRTAIAAGVLAASLSLSTLAYAQGEPIKSETGSRQNDRTEKENLKTQKQISTITGTVKDSNEAAIVGAKVILRDINSQKTRQTQTDENGFYQFTKVKTNVYILEIESAGFQKFVLENIIFSEGDKIEKSVVLEAGEIVGEMIIIETPLEKSDSQINDNVQTQKPLELPVNERIFTTMGLIPAAVPTEKAAESKKKKKKN